MSKAVILRSREDRRWEILRDKAKFLDQFESRDGDLISHAQKKIIWQIHCQCCRQASLSPPANPEISAPPFLRESQDVYLG